MITVLAAEFRLHTCRLSTSGPTAATVPVLSAPKANSAVGSSLLNLQEHTTGRKQRPIIWVMHLTAAWAEPGHMVYIMRTQAGSKAAAVTPGGAG